MTSRSENARRRQTRQMIRATFLALYAQKPLKEINVTDIALEADINRGTFYLHYFDLDDLVNDIEAEHLQALTSLLTRFSTTAAPTASLETLDEIFIPVLEYIQANRAEFAVLLGEHSRANFLQALQDRMRTNIQSRLIPSTQDPARQALIIEYIVSANLGVIVQWVRSEMPLPAAEITRLLSQLSLRGPFPLLHL